MIIAETIADLKRVLGDWSAERRHVGLVPTMGALHAGHIALIREAAATCDKVIITVFVNPLQFGPGEDYLKYPRPLDRDATLAKEAGADLLFTPKVDELTPPDRLVTVDPGPMAEVLCGLYRPGHFRGVCTIVLKLLNLTQPQVAFFGWKDAQQLIILKKMVSDLNVPVQMRGVETLRETSGLALSSRNLYLTNDQKGQAVVLHQILSEAREQFVRTGRLEHDGLLSISRKQLDANPLIRLQYLEMVDKETLSLLQEAAPGCTLVAIAAFAGDTRLIDNVRF